MGAGLKNPEAPVRDSEYRELGYQVSLLSYCFKLYLGSKKKELFESSDSSTPQNKPIMCCLLQSTQSNREYKRIIIIFLI